MNDRLSQIWRAPAPPDDLAARTLERWQRVRARRRRSTGVAAVVAVAAAALLMWWSPRPEHAGAIAADERSSVDLAGRVAAVAEAGAALSWRAEVPAVDIDQRRGRVFYRVERGERARVQTPAGAVAAEGSCFSVEVRPMKSEILSAAGGAAVAVAVVVVYQGAVTAESEQGAVTAGAGERVSLAAGGSPEVGSSSAPIAAAPAGASRDELLARDRLLVKRIVALQSQVGDLEARLASATGDDKSDELSDDKFFDLSDGELALLADRCEIRYDVPGWGLSRNLGPHLARMFEDSGLPAHEQEVIREVMAAGDPELLRVIRELYIEVTGDRAGADTISPRNLQHEVFEKSRPGDLSEALRRISAERAGRAEPPEDLASRPAVERLLRALVASGAVLEQRLAAQLGAARARELRKAGVGYGRRRQSGCPDAE